MPTFAHEEVEVAPVRCDRAEHDLVEDFVLVFFPLRFEIRVVGAPASPNVSGTSSLRRARTSGCRARKYITYVRSEDGRLWRLSTNTRLHKSGTIQIERLRCLAKRQGKR